MKIMTFNVQHFYHWNTKKIDIPFFAEFIKKYDIDYCGLNEVRSKGPVDGYTDQTDALAELTGFEGFFGEAIKVKGTSPYGNAFISRLPVKSAEVIKIADPKIKIGGRYETRCIIKNVISADGTQIMILVCHMGLMKSERKNAVKAICKIIDSTDMPCILLGDFNTEPDDEMLSPIYARMTDTAKADKLKNEPTYPSFAPKSKIDYIFFRGLKLINTETINEVVSDHLPIIAEFGFND